MELDKFIEQTLVSIRSGLKNANQEIKNIGEGNYYMGSDDTGEITFDIAVTVSEQGAKKGGGSINVYTLKIGGDLENKTAAETVSRIKFKVRPYQRHS